MSRPWSSVPSQNVPPAGDGDPGGSRLSITSSCARSYGFCGEISGANSARNRMTPSSASPKTATGFATKSVTIRRKRRLGVRAAVGATAQPLTSVSRTRGSSAEYSTSTSRLMTMKTVTMTSR